MSLPYLFPIDIIKDPLNKLKVEQYYRTFVLGRYAQYGDGHFILACYGAFPALMNSDLLYRIWLNFGKYQGRKTQTHIPQVAVSDLLLSPLFNEIRNGVYEMPQEIRNGFNLYLQLITIKIEWKTNRTLASRTNSLNPWGLHSLEELAYFLIAYLKKYRHSEDNTFYEMQWCTAASYVDPVAAKAFLSKKLSDTELPVLQARYSKAVKDIAERFRLEIVKDPEEIPTDFKKLTDFAIATHNFLFGKEDLAIEKYNEIAAKGGVETENQEGQFSLKISEKIAKKVKVFRESDLKRKTVFALLVGLDRYSPEASVRPLTGCVNDINEIEQALRELDDGYRFRIQITKLIDDEASKAVVLEALRTIFQAAKPEDHVFLMFEGHTKKTEDERNSIVLYDSDAFGANNLLYMELETILRKTENDPHVFMVLDSGRDWLDNGNKKHVFVSGAKSNDNLPAADGGSFGTFIARQILRKKEPSTYRGFFREIIQHFQYSNTGYLKRRPQLYAFPEYTGKILFGEEDWDLQFEHLLRITAIADMDQAIEKFAVPKNSTKKELISRLLEYKIEKNEKDQPIFLFIFSDPKGSLVGLKKEKEALSAMFLGAVDEKQIELIFEEEPSLARLRSLFCSPIYRNRIQLLHFAGFSTEYNFGLVDDELNYSELLQWLNYQENIKLAFWNTCLSEHIAESAAQLGIATTIGAEGVISDDLAYQSAILFYTNWVEKKLDTAITFKETTYQLERIKYSSSSIHRAIGTAIGTKKKEAQARYRFFQFPWANDLMSKTTFPSILERRKNLPEPEKRIWDSESRYIKVLDLSDLDLSEVPEKVARLSHLEVLNLSNNNLSSLPVGFSSLTALKEINLANNYFVEVPTNLPTNSLQRINFENNKIVSFRISVLDKLTRVKSLLLKGNPVTDTGVIGRAEEGVSSLLKHLIRRSDWTKIQAVGSVGQRIYALLVGINRYHPDSNAGPLKGPVNDVKAFTAYLENYSAGTDRELNIFRLFDEEATHANIIRSFQQFEDARDGDICIFYFSGFGSRRPVPSTFEYVSPSMQQGAITCYDSRLKGGKDLTGMELSFLIGTAVRDKDIHFLLITDCSYCGRLTSSFGGSPEINDNQEHKDSRYKKPPYLDPTEYFGIGDYDKNPAGRYYPLIGSHIHLASCREDQNCKELQVLDGNRGAFSYFLVDVLNRTQGRISYSELIEQVRIRAQNTIQNQSPQLFSTNSNFLNNLFLSNISLASAFYLIAYDHKLNYWFVNAGAIHGMKVEDEEGGFTFSIAYPEGYAVVTEVLPVRSKVQLNKELEREHVYQARPVIGATSGVLFSFSVDSEEEGITIIRNLVSTSPANYLEVALDSNEADYVIHAKNNGYHLTTPANFDPLFNPIKEFSIESAKVFTRNFDKVCNWFLISTLFNPRTKINHSEIRVDFYRITEPNNYEDDAEREEVDIYSKPTFSYLESNGKLYEPAFQLKVKNNAQKELWFSLVFFSADYGITNQLIQKQVLAPGEEVWAFYIADSSRIYRTIPLHINQPSILQARTNCEDLLKLFISNEEFDTHSFNQDALESNANQIHRGFRGLKREAAANADWTVIDIPFEVVRPGKTGPQPEQK